MIFHKPPRYLELNSVLYFKKHRGKTLKEVIDTDIAYIVWLQTNEGLTWTNCKLNSDAFAYYCEKLKENGKVGSHNGVHP